MAIRGSIKVVLVGRGSAMLGSANYVATGGEGSIYRFGDTVVKLYAAPEEKRRAGVFEKIKLLVALNHPYIVAPQGLVTDPAGKAIGYYMPYIAGEALPRIFTNDFRRREGFDDRDAKAFTARMRDAVIFAHGAKAVLVDANEFNWLALFEKSRKCEPRIIDVDSWAIGNFNGQVIMPSIRDWHVGGFTPASDWFAWGVVSFQIFTGTHPYKGSLDGYASGDLERRMKDNASVFRRGIRLNRAVRDFSCIPAALLDWYGAAFEKGERSVPPSPLGSGVTVSAAAKTLCVTNTPSGALILEKIFEMGRDEAVRVFPCGAVLLRSGKLFDIGLRREIGNLASPRGEAVRKENGWLLADFKEGAPKLSFVNAANLNTEPLTPGIRILDFLRFENRLFARTERGITELIVQHFARPLISAGQSWSVLPQAVKWFDGLGIEDALGAIFLILPFGEKALVRLRARELDGFAVLTAKSGGGAMVCIGADNKGSYRRFDFHFDAARQTYRVWQAVVDGPELNATLLPRGVSATISEDGELVIFVPANGNLNKVADQGITTEMSLANWNDAVVCVHNGAVWRVRLR